MKFEFCALSEFSEFEVHVGSRLKQLDPNTVLDWSTELSVYQDGRLKKIWRGVVAEVKRSESVSPWDIKFRSFFKFIIKPAHFRLTLRQNCRIFQNQSVSEIIELLLGEMRIIHFKIWLFVPGELPSREYCVQYRESDAGICSI